MTAELVCAAGSEDWLAARREGITATDIVTIAGLVTWDSPWALYHRKLGLLPEVEQSDRMRLGSWLERSIAEHWQRTYHHAGDLADDPGWLWRSSVRPWQLATPDFTVTGYDSRAEQSVLECKTASRRDGWGEDGSDQVPAHVRAQVLWQMDTLGVSTGHVAVVFLPSGEFRSYTIRHDAKHDHDPVTELSTCAPCNEIGDLRDLGFGFWSRILRRDPPDLDGLEVTTEALRYVYPERGGTIELDEYGRGLMDKYDELGELRRVADLGFKKAQNQIRDFMGDNHEATTGGHVVFRRTVSKRAGYTVPPGETDTLRRIGKDKHDD